MDTRTEINQANAQHSTGPKTPEGKQRSSQNALRHGLTSQIPVLPTEDPQAYHRHVKSFHDEYHPVGATESHLVQSLADTAWRQNRIATLETNFLIQTDVDLERQLKALANLSLHSQRLARQFERAIAQLRALQKIRRAQEKEDLSNLLDVMEMYEAKGETYEPSEDGFVFTKNQINQAILARNQERVIDEAWEYQNAA